MERLGREVSVVGLGTWQLGAEWGDVDGDDAKDVLKTAHKQGITFYDTADVYGDGRSEQFVGALRRQARRRVRGHQDGPPAWPSRWSTTTPANFEAWNRRSRENLGVERLDLVQLHCPPDEVYEDDGVFQALDEMVERGQIAAYGVSVETCAQALKAIARPRVATVQIMLNCFRLKPLDRGSAGRAQGRRRDHRPRAARLRAAVRAGTTRTRRFAADDHRTYNRHGEKFDVGETFAGVPFEVGLKAAARAQGAARGGSDAGRSSRCAG